MMQGLRLIVTSYKMTTLASFPGHRRNGLAISTSSNNGIRKLAVYQSNFRTLSRDKSKMQSCHAFKHHIHTHSIDSTTVGALHNDFCSKDFWFTSMVEPSASMMGPSGGSHSRKIHITCTNLIFTAWMRPYIRIQFELAEVARLFSYGLETRTWETHMMHILKDQYSCFWHAGANFLLPL